MASDSDDADFFDKLVDSDDDDRRPLPLAAAADLAEPSAGDLAALTHAADEAEAAAAHPEAPSEPVAAPAVAKSEVVHPEAPQVEAASPTSDKGAVKQAQWNDVGAASGADPLGDFSTDGADDAFFEEGAAVPMGQASQASLQAAASVVDHSFSSGVSEDANANSHLDSGAAAMESVDQSNNAQVTDTRYWESLYPGWKYDEATQQWYQIDTLSSHHNAVEVQAQPEAPHVEAASPRSDKGAVKQAQWNNFGAANGADPLGDFSMDGAEDAFFDEGAAVPRDQASQASLQAAASAVDHRFSSGVWEDANANSHLDSGAAVMESMDQSTNAQVTDPRYWESLYPGWKYDEATQQWYQIDTLSSHQNAVEVQAQPEAATTWPDSDELKPATVDPGAEAEAALPVPEPAPVHPEAVVEAHPSVPNHGSEPPESTGPSLKVEADAAPEGSSSSSCKSVQTTVKQVHWNDFGASNGADLFGDLVADGAEDAFFDGAVPGEQALQSRAALAVNHSFSTGVSDGNANSQLDNSATGTNHTQFDSADPRYWESLYPGWKYDDTTGQWYHVDTLSAQQNYSGAVVALGADSIHQREFCASYMHNYSHAALEPISEEGTTNDVNWGQDGSYAAPAEYPPSMLFYAEYPGWYFDTNTQQWQSLEVYQQTVAQTSAASDGFAGTGHSAPQTQDSHTNTYAQHSQWQPDALGNIMQPDSSADSDILGNSYGSGIKAENQFGQQADAQPLQSASKYSNTFVPSTSQYTGTDTKQASYEGLQSSVSHQNAYKGLEQSTSDSNSSMGYQSGYTGSAPYTGHQGFKPFTSKRNWSKGFGHSTGQEVAYKGFVPSTGYQTGFEPSKDHQFSHMAYEPSTNHGYGSFVPNESMYKEQTHADSVAHMHLPNNYGGTHGSGDFAQQLSVGPNGPSQQFGFSPHEQRSSAGRPPHALVTFGFGGKLIVLKEISSITANFDSRNQGNSGRTVSILNITEIVADKIDHSNIPSSSALSYFHALCRRPIPGPLVGGSATAKDVNKWLDDIIGGYESSLREFHGGDVQKLLISLLKILCQHYGKLRSPFGSDPLQEGVDGPEMAVTKLFASCKSNANMKGYGSAVHCMKNIPMESQIQATAQEVQNLLISGRRKEALYTAQEGQLWGPALILALQLGDKFYADTVKKMAHCHFESGAPLRTLCLLIAGQPAGVFNFENPVDSGSLHTAQPPVEQAVPKGMLDDWQENLAILTANRTKDDDLVITHLGDCLWKEKNEVVSAHSCYLVAELNIDSYSESARMCLIGADHLQCPRTFSSPEAIQRTEVYEYAKVLGNSQYILLPFQPYKLIYAYMLVEVGKVSDSLRYCQTSLKALKASGRVPELEALKQSFFSLEERIRTHQQGGYAINLAPGKIVGKIFTSLDKSLSRMMGTQSAPLPQLPQGAANERYISAVPDTKVANTPSVMAMSPLMSSASELSMSEISGAPDRKASHNRSVSEPDFGRTPQKDAGSGNAQSTSGSGSSRFGWLVQKTMGLVSKSHKQAKLGQQNKFYYDEKLKRWVEEGAEVRAEEPPLPPPPTKASFQNAVPNYSSNGPVGGGDAANGFADVKTSNAPELSSGMPPMPPTQNQFSARGRMGVRSRYVDTFNKGSGATAFRAATSFSKPAAPSMTPLSGAKFFVPTPAAVAAEQMPGPKVDAEIETTHHDGQLPSPALEAVFSSLPPSEPMPSTIQRHPSMDNIMTPSDRVDSSLSKSRAASWSGTYPDQFSSTAASRSPDGQKMQSPMMPGRRPPHSRSSSNSSIQFSGMVEDLHEVEL